MFYDFPYFSIQFGISSSQLTNSIIFQRGRSATNQMPYTSHDWDPFGMGKCHWFDYLPGLVMTVT